MPRNQFIDPAGVVPTYDWHINHGWEGEQEHGVTRRVEHVPTTDGNGTIRQQGASDPVQLTLSGTILELEQHDQFELWTALCEDRTIYYKEFTGVIYEVFIVSFTSAKHGVARNQRGGADAPNHIWRWTMVMEVIGVVS